MGEGPETSAASLAGEGSQGVGAGRRVVPITSLQEAQTRGLRSHRVPATEDELLELLRDGAVFFRSDEVEVLSSDTPLSRSSGERLFGVTAGHSRAPSRAQEFSEEEAVIIRVELDRR